MKKYTREELFKMDAVEVYKLVLQREVKIFPSGFWMQPEAKQNAAKCVRFLIEDILQFSDEEIKNQLSVKLFQKYKLSGMLSLCFNNSLIHSIENAYPNKFKPWEFKNNSNGYWKEDENIIESIKWLIEEKLNLTDKELKEQLSVPIFCDNGLGGMLSVCFNNSPYKAINKAYPSKFKPWEFKNVSVGYWKDVNNAIEATKWLIEDKLKLTDKEIKEQLSINLFSDNGLNGMLNLCYNGSPFKAINAAYPNKFKPWEFKYVSMSYWKNIDNGIQATKWLIEEKLKLSDEELKEQLSIKLFVNNGLSGMLNKCFNDSPYNAINLAYPNKFKPWEFKNVSVNFWQDKKNIINATKWLIEEKLKLSDKELKEKLSARLFVDNGLGSMLNSCLDGSPYEAINTAYPGKFKKEDFKNYR